MLQASRHLLRSGIWAILLYCIATALLLITDLEKSLKRSDQKIKTDKIGLDDVKTKSKILKEFLNDFAAREGIELKLRTRVQTK